MRVTLPLLLLLWGAAACRGRDAARQDPVAVTDSATARQAASQDSTGTIQSWMIMDFPGGDHIDSLRYGAELRQAGRRFVLRLDSLTGYQGERPVWHTLRTIDFGVLPDSQTMMTTCGPAPDRLNSRTVAIVANTDTSALRPLIRAWYLTIPGLDTVPLSRDSTVCAIEGWGEG